jgi:hypothetical protein
MPISTSALPGTTILNLPITVSLDGTEYIPIVQGGTTKRTQTGSVSNILSNLPLVLTTSAPVGYSNSRKLAGQTGVVSITDGGASSNVTVGLLSSGLSVLGNTSTTAGSAAGAITGTTDQVLRVSSAGTALGFGQVNMASSNAVSNVLGTNFGGTGSSAFTPYQLIIGGSISSAPFQSVTAGTSGFTLIYTSSIAAPTWQSAPGFVQAVAGNIAIYTSTNSVGGSAYINGSSGSLTLGLASSATGKLLLASSAGGTTTIQPTSATVTITAPSATTTLVGQDTVDTLTGKTFNTAGSSNHLLINGTSITAITGSGNTVVLNSTPTISSAAISGGQVNALSSFGLRTTGAAFDLVIGSTETLTASRNLNIRVGDANRNLVLSGDFTVASSFPIAITSTAASSLSVPVTGTLATLAGAETFTNKIYDTNLNTFKIAGTPVVTMSNMLDIIGSSQGAIIYRSSTAWTALTAGTSAQTLIGGSAPQWGSIAGSGTVTNISFGSVLFSTNGTSITSSGTISVNATLNPTGRLTFSTGNPVMTATVTASSIVFYTPYVGNLVPVYNGTQFIPTAFTELSQNSTDIVKSPSAAAANTVYDVFVWNDAGTLRCTRGSSWATSTTRASSGALSRINGVLTNTSAITNGPGAGLGTYVGTIATSTGAATFDWILGAAASGGTAASLQCWNMYNRVDITTQVTDSGVPYTYTSATTRQARASAGNQVSFVIGQSEDGMEASYGVRGTLLNAASALAVWSIGLDSIVAATASPGIMNNVAAVSLSYGFNNNVYVRVGIGSHFIAALEASDGTNANTFNSGSTNILMFKMRM